MVLFITRSRHNSIASTFKVVGYAEAAMVFNILPVIGPIVAFFYWIYLVITGIHSFHSVSKGRALLALFLPFFLLLILLFIGIIILAIVGFLFTGSSPQDFFSF